MKGQPTDSVPLLSMRHEGVADVLSAPLSLRHEGAADGLSSPLRLQHEGAADGLNTPLGMRHEGVADALTDAHSELPARLVRDGEVEHAPQQRQRHVRHDGRVTQAITHRKSRHHHVSVSDCLHLPRTVFTIIIITKYDILLLNPHAFMNES